MEPSFDMEREIASAWSQTPVRVGNTLLRSVPTADQDLGRNPADAEDDMPASAAQGVPPAFAPGALDLLRERVVRMRRDAGGRAEERPIFTREFQPEAPVPQAWAGSPLADAADADYVDDAPSADTSPGLARQLSQIRDALDRLGGADQQTPLALAVVALGRKIDLLNAKALDPVALRRLELQTTELRAAVERAVKLREPEADGTPPAWRDYADEMRAAARAAAETQARMDRELEALHARLQRVSAEIEALPEEFAAALGEQVALLLARIEDGAGVEVAALAPLVDVIERHFIALTARLAASDARLERLDGIEQALDRISLQMEDLQHASADVSAEAVQAVALRLSARDDAPAVLGLKRGLAELEARQRAFEARTEDLLVRELELELKDLAGRTPTPRGRRATAEAEDDVWPDAGLMPAVDLDRRIFDPAIGDEIAAPGPATRADWLAAAERASRIDHAPRRATRRLRLNLIGRAAVLTVAVGLAGLTVLQVVYPNASHARPAPGQATDARSAQTPAPVQASDPARLPMPAVPDDLRTAALAGDPAAAYEIGARFTDGRGVEANAAAGKQWLALAAARGSVPAAYKLGSVYEYADRNYVEARRLYAWAAERGNLRAMHNLGVLATAGVDGRPDWAAAIKWFRQAAERGLRDSQHNLGMIFARGLSGTTDFAEAFKWFAVSAANGDTDSARKRDDLVRRADEPTLNRGRAMAAAFVAAPMDKAANVVAVKPEWDKVVSANAAPAARSGT
ncbi:tetratricopeptide repeat protein [Aquabacter spiritensis]|uniref:Localization factor PodJL n=1 Tax=Aquabacter spiritensis TaxID=933073 RepID=A0A4R3LZ61_9HYPH|nr:tetratricopeptide repeat protein [Aquabacter spiritensis]TCT05566.1 localization factor PodJL [Aquabacter spiritensis]